MGSTRETAELIPLQGLPPSSSETVLASMSDSKVNSDLKDAIEKEGNIDKLKDTTTTSGSGAAFSMSMYGIEKFNKDKLTHTETEEKNVLPDAQTIQQEKEAATA